MVKIGLLMDSEDSKTPISTPHMKIENKIKLAENA